MLGIVAGKYPQPFNLEKSGSVILRSVLVRVHGLRDLKITEITFVTFAGIAKKRKKIFGARFNSKGGLEPPLKLGATVSEKHLAFPPGIQLINQISAR